MTGLCGWFSEAGTRAAGRYSLDRGAALLCKFDGSMTARGQTPLGEIALSDACHNAKIFSDGTAAATLWGTARFSESRLAEEAATRGTLPVLVSMVRQRELGALDKLSGSYALAVVDSDTGTAVLAVDRLATHPLCYRIDPSGITFASTLDALHALTPDLLEVDPQAIYDYMYFHAIPGPKTVYKDCCRLLPGECLRYRDGELEIHRYWTMQYTEDSRRPFADLKSEFLGALRGSVRRACDDETHVGAFLSGGTDSSTLAGLLGEVTGSPARTYSIGFDVSGFDETYYAQLAVRHFNTRHQEYRVSSKDVVTAISQIAAIHDQPFGNSSAVPTYYCAKLARADGIELLLGGDGGDELFGGNARYAKQYLYSLYSNLPAFIRRGLIEPVALAVDVDAGPLGKLQRYLRNASIPMPARYDTYNLLERLGAASVFTSDFIATIDTGGPARDMAECYAAAQARSLINRMLALDLKYTLADNDLPKVMRSCELAGVSVRFPMLDDEVVDFSARLAPELKLRRTKLRYFFKEALRGFLPEEIITKSKHGFGLPFGTWIQSDHCLRELVMDSLSGLRQRSIVRPAFIDELMGERVGEHADYYGTMVWVLMMLEQWFQLHETRRATVSIATPRRQMIR